MGAGGLSAHLDPLEWMTLGARATGFHDACAALSPRLSDIGAATAGLVHDMPMKFGTFPTEDEMWGHFVNDAWHGYYAENRYLIRHDIMARHLFTSARPQYVDTREWRTFPFIPKTPGEKDFVARVIDFGLFQSLAMAVPDSKAGTVSHFMLNRGRDDAGDMRELGTRHLEELQLAVRFFFEGLKIRQLAENVPFGRLSARERDCLQWAAVGKTTQEIADLMGLADDTVNEYFASARRKLRAANRTQAVVRAISVGLISP